MKIKTERLLPLLLLYAGNSYALDWLLSPDLSFTERYADNLRMQVLPHKSNLVTTLAPSFMAGYVADDNELQARFNYNQLFYSNETQLDFAEKIVNVNHKFYSDRWKTNVTGFYGVQSSLTTQSEIGSLGNSILVGAVIPRYTRSVNPEVTYQLSEKNSLELSGSYADVTYSFNPTNALGGYLPYTNEMLNLTLNHKYSDKLSFNATGGYSIYDTSKPLVEPNYLGSTAYPSSLAYSQNSKTFTGQLGFQYAFSEQMLLTAGGGIRDSNTHSVNNYTVAGLTCAQLQANINNHLAGSTPYSCSTINSTTNGSLYNVSFKRDFESGSVNVGYFQQLNPSSTGSQQQTQSFTLSSNYDLSDRWKLGFTGSYTEVTAIAGYLSNQNSYAYLNRNLISLSPNCRWDWTPEVNLQLSYLYLDQNYTQINQTATANSIQFQFNYQPQINRQVK
jgi:hypothetical protein